MNKEQPNLKYLEDIANGDESFKVKLLDIIKLELPQEVAEFQENFKRSKFSKAAENVHKLKHKINIFGMEAGYKIAANFENELKEGTFKHHSEFMGVLKTIEDFLDSV